MKNNLLKKMFFASIMLSCSVIFAQTVSGTVSDASGPLPGANVVVQGTTNGVTADFDGNYSIDAPSDGVLVFSFVGYVTQEVAVEGQSSINATLEEDANVLEEVVVMGYTTQTRGDITGSVASVDMDEAMKAPIANAAEALQGRVTGVTVVNNGSPGSPPKINIRGFGTSNNTNPLYIIDGVQTDDTNALNNINPADIEQMNVLKDGAAAIYGARASNGVIVITTKSGGYNMSGAKLSLDMYTGFSEVTNSPDLLNAQQHANVLLQSRLNDGTDTTHGQYDPSGSGTYTVPSSINGYKRVVSYNPITFSNNGDFSAAVNPGGTNWYDAITQTAPTSNFSLSLQNGGESGKYFMSVNYLDREGVLNHTGFERISTRLNSEFKMLDGKLIVGEHMNVAYTNSTGGNGEAIENSIRMTPLLPVYDDNGEFTGVAGDDLGNTRNPVAQLYRGRDDYNKRFSAFGDIYLSYDILDELQFKTVLGAGFNTFDRRQFTALDPEHGEPISTNSLTEEDQTNWNWIWTNTLRYSKDFGDHHVDAILGIESLKGGGKGKSVTNTDYLFETPDFYLLNNGAGNPQMNYAYDGWSSLWSYFLTANYSYQSKYFLTATFRNDTSSRFVGDNQSDSFISVSAGWELSKEDWYPENSFAERIKLKASYGELGNQTLPPGLLTSDVYNLNAGQANYALNGSSITSGALLASIGNPSLVWEKSITKNLGVDFAFLENRLLWSFEYYNIETDGLIKQNLSTNPSTGSDASAPYENIGNVENTGFDTSIGWRDQTDGGFSYGINVNISHYKNETSNFDDVVFGRGDIRNGAVTKTENGEEMSYFYGRNVTGIDSNGRFIYEDVSGPDGVPDGIINDDDRTNIGSPHPDFTYGINVDLAYKGWDAQLFFTGSQGNDLYNYNKVFTDFGYFYLGNRSTRVLDAWTPSNTGAELSAVSGTITNDEDRANSYFVEDGSYFKLKNLQIGYSIPENIIDKWGIDGLRLYVQGSNLFTITSYNGLDPEVVAYDNLSLGVDYRIYPPSKIYTIGVNFKL